MPNEAVAKVKKDRSRLGPVLLRLRKLQEMSRHDVGDALGVKYPRVNQVETGTGGNLHFSTMERWLDAVHADLYDMADAYYETSSRRPRKAPPREVKAKLEKRIASLETSLRVVTERLELLERAIEESTEVELSASFKLQLLRPA